MSDNNSDVPPNGQAESNEPGECFVIAPIGGPQSETRKRTDGLLDEAIRPVVEDTLGLQVIAPHEIAEAGSITRQVIQRLLEAEFVVADLTNLNANVMYELAVRHAKGKPVVPIAEKSTTLPFDITTERTVFYEDSMHGLKELKPKLEDAARATLGDEEPDNPIYRAQQDFQMREAAAGDDKMEYLLQRLDDIESVLARRTDPENRSGRSDDNIGISTFKVVGDLDTLDHFRDVLPTVLRQSNITIFDYYIKTSLGDSENSHVVEVYHDSDLIELERLIQKAAKNAGLKYGGHIPL